MRTIRAVWVPVFFSSICVWLCWTSWFFVVPSVFGCGDVIQRWRDFRRWRNLPADKRILRMARYSRCQRNAMVAACSDQAKAERYYAEAGYRFWHILPDKTFSRKSPFIKMAFYRSLLGV